MGVLANPSRGTQLLPQGARISGRGLASVLIVPPSPNLWGSAFSIPGQVRPGQPVGTHIHRGRRGGAAQEGEGAEAAWHGPRPGFGGWGQTRQRHCAPAALLPGGVAARSQPFHLPVSFPPSLPPCPAPLPGLSAPVSLAVCPTRVARLWTPLCLPTFHLVPGSLPGFFLLL